MKEILKLLELGIIFPIFGNEWVSLVRVIPKKTGITLVQNERNELVPMKLQNWWRMCIDFRKLNAATRKDHFLLPFINEMLERLAGNVSFAFLMATLGIIKLLLPKRTNTKSLSLSRLAL
mgnify:CR=1 FL=1